MDIFFVFYFETKSTSFERVAKREDDEFSKRLQSPLVATDLCFCSPCIIADDDVVIAATGLGLHQICRVYAPPGGGDERRRTFSGD